MKRNTFTLFLLCVFLCSFICFGAIIFLNYTFSDVFRLPIPTVLFILGGLLPGLVGYMLAKGRGELNLFKVKNANSIIMVLIFAVLHVSLYNIFGNLEPTSNRVALLLSIPIAIVIFGLQEIGWIKLVQEKYEKEKSYIRSIIIVGLLKSLAFLPLVFLRGFPSDMNSLTYFAAMLVGISALSISSYKNGKAFILPIILTGILYGIMVSVNLNQGMTMVLIGAIEVALVFYLQDFIKH